MAEEKTHTLTSKNLLFKRNRNGSEHADNCTDGYIQPKGKSPSWLQIHHALCVHACSNVTFPQSITEAQRTFIEACFEMTEWNINGPDNNIGLPCKWPYVEDPDNGTGWDKYPCHQVDHDLYLTAVETYVTEKIWLELLNAQEEKKCEEIKGENIAHYFNTGSSTWKDMLKTRGQSYGGTKGCLDYCVKGTAAPLELVGNEEKWYVPFSMAPSEDEARERVKPPKLEAGEKLNISGLLGIVD